MAASITTQYIVWRKREGDPIYRILKRTVICIARALAHREADAIVGSALAKLVQKRPTNCSTTRAVAGSRTVSVMRLADSACKLTSR